jgi:hypothetical protein
VYRNKIMGYSPAAKVSEPAAAETEEFEDIPF